VRIARPALLVVDHDEYINFHRSALGFCVLMEHKDERYGHPVQIAPSDKREVGVRLIECTDIPTLGPSAGKPQLVLHTNDQQRILRRARTDWARIKTGPFDAGDGRVAHVLDPSGNELTLAQLCGRRSPHHDRKCDETGWNRTERRPHPPPRANPEYCHPCFSPAFRASLAQLCNRENVKADTAVQNPPLAPAQDDELPPMSGHPGPRPPQSAAASGGAPAETRSSPG